MLSFLLFLLLEVNYIEYLVIACARLHLFDVIALLRLKFELDSAEVVLLDIVLQDVCYLVKVVQDVIPLLLANEIAFDVGFALVYEHGFNIESTIITTNSGALFHPEDESWFHIDGIADVDYAFIMEKDFLHVLKFIVEYGVLRFETWFQVFEK